MELQSVGTKDRRPISATNKHSLAVVATALAPSPCRDQCFWPRIWPQRQRWSFASVKLPSWRHGTSTSTSSWPQVELESYGSQRQRLVCPARFPASPWRCGIHWEWMLSALPDAVGLGSALQLKFNFLLICHSFFSVNSFGGRCYHEWSYAALVLQRQPFHGFHFYCWWWHPPVHQFWLSSYRPLPTLMSH